METWLCVGKRVCLVDVHTTAPQSESVKLPWLHCITVYDFKHMEADQMVPFQVVETQHCNIDSTILLLITFSWGGCMAFIINALIKIPSCTTCITDTSHDDTRHWFREVEMCSFTTPRTNTEPVFFVYLLVKNILILLFFVVVYFISPVCAGCWKAPSCDHDLSSPLWLLSLLVSFYDIHESLSNIQSLCSTKVVTNTICFVKETDEWCSGLLHKLLLYSYMLLILPLFC